MNDVEHFALVTLITAAAVVAAVLSNRISVRIRVPASAISLLAAAIASDLAPALVFTGTQDPRDGSAP